MVGLAPAQVPAPAVLIAAHQRLVASGVERSLLGGHPHHGVGPVLPAGPHHREHVETAAVGLPAPDTVCALGHWVAMETQQVVLLHEDVEAPVVRVPGVLDLLHLLHWRGVQRHLHPDRQLLGDNGAAGRLVRAALFKVSISITFNLLHPPGDSRSHARVVSGLSVRLSAGRLPGPVVSAWPLRSADQTLSLVPLSLLRGLSPPASSCHVPPH